MMDFKDVMAKKTNNELIEIVTVDRYKFQPLAIENAEAEINKRGIDIETIEKIKSDLTTKIEEKTKLDSKKVGSLSRFINFTIDLIIWLIISAMLTFWINANDPLQQLIGYGILLCSYLGYYYFMETKYQKTIAKFITKTKVVNNDGNKPNSSDILRRTLYRLIPFDRISFLFSANGFHDRLSETTLIKDKR